MVDILYDVCTYILYVSVLHQSLLQFSCYCVCLHIRTYVLRRYLKKLASVHKIAIEKNLYTRVLGNSDCLDVSSTLRNDEVDLNGKGELLVLSS